MFPADVIEWARAVFAAGNLRVSTKIDLNPNAPEESLDLSWIEHLSNHSAPTQLGSGWTVQIQTHYLGGLRHWRRWEIADIGLLLFADLGPNQRVSKTALLQSKRLYPTSGAVEEETELDYVIGFGRLADPEDLARPLGFTRTFEFAEDSRYGAVSAGSDQISRIDEYQDDVGLRVYYQLYNPSEVPFEQTIPLTGSPASASAVSHGARVVRASDFHALLSAKPEHYRPKLSDLADIPGLVDGIGWRLEDFVADEWLGCREGDRFQSVQDEPITRLFNRRSGPIAAAISLRLESPDAAL